MTSNQNEAELKELSGLAREESVSAPLEERCIELLRSQGLLGGRSAWKVRWMRYAGAAAAGLLLFAAGWAAAQRSLPAANLGGGAGYLLLMRAGASDTSMPTEEPNRDQEYRAWAEDLSRRGVLVSARKLHREVTMLETAGGPPTHHGVTFERNGVLGFFLIQAASMDEALRIARESPHFKYGGVIEVRPVVTPKPL